jgi:hypothetical protein
MRGGSGYCSRGELCSALEVTLGDENVELDGTS